MNTNSGRMRGFARWILTSAILVIFQILIIFPIRVEAYEDVVIVVDPGHGGVVTDDNTNGGCMYNNLLEKDVNLTTAQALFDELSTYQNVTAYMTRSTDVEMSIPDRIAYAKSVGADVIISVHYNASADHNFYGSEIFTSMYGESYATGNGLAQCIQKRWTNYGTISKGIKTREGNNGDYYGLIRQGNEEGIPTIILEHGYLDNDKDYLRIGNSDAWMELGRMDAVGIAEYYGFKKDVVLADVKPTVKVAAPKNPKKPDTTAPENVKLVVTDYDVNSGEVKYSLSASETDSMLMYYGFVAGDINDDTIFEVLETWDNGTGIQSGMFMAPSGFDGKLTARVYNNYELYSDSEAVDLSVFAGEVNSDAVGSSEADGSINGNNTDAEADGKLAGTDGPQIINEIIVGDQMTGTKERKHIDITSEMVDEAFKSRMETNKAMVGLIATVSTVLFVVALIVVIFICNSSKKGRKRR